MNEQMTLQYLIEQKEKAYPGYRDGYMMGHAIGQYEAILSVLDVITNNNIESNLAKEDAVKALLKQKVRLHPLQD